MLHSKHSQTLHSPAKVQIVNRIIPMPIKPPTNLPNLHRIQPHPKPLKNVNKRPQPQIPSPVRIPSLELPVNTHRRTPLTHPLPHRVPKLERNVLKQIVPPAPVPAQRRAPPQGSRPVRLVLPPPPPRHPPPRSLRRSLRRSRESPTGSGGWSLLPPPHHPALATLP